MRAIKHWPSPFGTYQMNKLLTELANKHFGIKTRKMDSLDFHNVAVWEVKEALKAAYDAGRKVTGKNKGAQ